jgi:hypothetical protein
VATKPTRTTAVKRSAPSLSSRSTARPSSLVYVYCIAESAGAPVVGRARGLPDAGTARAVPLAASRWLVLADVPRARFEERALEDGLRDLDWVGACAVAHDALIMHVMKTGPVLPMRLFTIFEDEARACAQAKAAAKKVTRTLRRVAGHAEYGVRIATSQRARQTSARPGQPATGRSFLEQKRDQLAARRVAHVVPLEERQRVFQRLAAAADEARERPIPEIGSSVWLDGAFLVPLRKAPAFRREVQRLAGELQAEGHEVVLTGPWPPYSFLDEHAPES